MQRDRGNRGGGTVVKVLGTCTLLFFYFIAACSPSQSAESIEEIAFDSGAFRVVGDLRLPAGKGPHPVILFVHGDGPNSRTAGGTYLPIMERMLRTGYATFAWDKPGTGESTGEIDRSIMIDQRAQIVLDAIAAIKQRPEIDIEHIGLWGISQAGYVMPKVLSRSGEIAFMIAVSCPGGAGVDQGAYLVSAQAVCAGLPADDAGEVERLLSDIERVRTYEEYVQFKKQLAGYPVLSKITLFGLNMAIMPEEQWHAGDLEGVYFWDPMQVIEGTTIPVLAIFGARDTQVDPNQGVQAYTAALEKAGNPNSRVELIPGADHIIVLVETGCLEEIGKMSRAQRLNYAPQYLELLEEWLQTVHP